MKKYYSLIIALMLLIFTPPVAAESATLSLNPPVVEVLIAPNKKVTQTFTLGYQGENVSVIPELYGIKAQGSHGHVEMNQKPLDPATIPLIITSSLPLGKPAQLHGDTLTLTLTFEAASIDIAQDVYVALVIRTSSASLESSSETTPAISALILASLNPSGVTPINLDIQNFAPSLIHDSWLPIEVAPILENHIPIMIRPIGTYEIIGPRGKTQYATPLYPNLLLGDSQRSVQGIKEGVGNLKLDISAGTLTPTNLSWQPKWYHIGPYRLRLTITTLGGTKLTDTEKVVWLLPIRLLAITLVILIFVIIFALRMRRRPDN